MKKIFIFLILLIVFTNFVSAFDTSNVVAYYSFDNDDTSGSISIDASGKYNATIDAVSTGHSCVLNECYYYDGDADKLLVTITEPIFATNGAISFWTNLTDGTIIERGDGSANYWGMFDVSNKLKMEVRGFDGGGGNNILTDENLYPSGASFTHVVFSKVGTIMMIFINGTNTKNVSVTASWTETEDTIKIGVFGANLLDALGSFDELLLYNTTLNQTGVNELYNSGAGLNPFKVSTETPFLITAKSFWSGNAISIFNASVNGTNYSTTNGTIITAFNNSNNYLLNITIFASDWFSESLEHNVSSNLNQALKQTQINISFNFSSGDLLPISLNLSALDINSSYNVSGGNQVLFPDEGIVNFSVSSYNNVFDTFNFSLNLSALDNSSFSFVVNETHNIITFLDANTGLAIANATIIITFPSNATLNLTTNSTGKINFSYVYNGTLEFGDYSYYFDKVGYLNVTLSDTINSSNIPHNKTYNLSRATLNIFVYDRETFNLLNGTNVEIVFVGLFNETINNGTLIKNNLTIPAGDYLIYASADGYKTSIRSLTFTNQEEFTLNFYLLNLTGDNSGTLFVSTKDSYFRDIPGAKVDLLEYIPANLSYISVDSCVSNVNAQCSFGVELNTKVYYIRATATIDNTLYIAETSQNGEIFTINNDLRELVFFTRGTFSVNTESKLVYTPSESFINNVSSISLDFFTTDGTAKYVCIEYLRLVGGSWVSVTGDTYCLFSSNALQNIDVDVTLNRSNTYKARIYVKESFDNVLKTYNYPSISSTEETFDDDLKGAIIILLWIGALSYCMHQKNITLFFVLGIVISWIEVILFPTFSMAEVSVFKTIVCMIGIYVSRKKEDYQ